MEEHPLAAYRRSNWELPTGLGIEHFSATDLSIIDLLINQPQLSEQIKPLVSCIAGLRSGLMAGLLQKYGYAVPKLRLDVPTHIRSSSSALPQIDLIRALQSPKARYNPEERLLHLPEVLDAPLNTIIWLRGSSVTEGDNTVLLNRALSILQHHSTSKTLAGLTVVTLTASEQAVTEYTRLRMSDEP